MPLIIPRSFIFLFCLSITLSHGQTVLNPGDIMVLGIATDMGACGLSAQGDEISFVSFKDITTNTTIDITDNGWEHQFTGFWGDSEGTLRMTRTGGTINAGTVITMQGQIVGGNWIYRTISPDIGWTFTNLNVPGGPFNMDNGSNGTGGDQVYFMQGGIWNNQGGGTNKALYSGRLLWAANTNDQWNADGTVNGSNLHPDVTPCYYSQAGTDPAYMNFTKYTGPIAGEYWDGDSYEVLSHFGYLYTVSSPAYWGSFQTCSEYNAADWTYSNGQTIEIGTDMGLSCSFCFGCAPFDLTVQVTLPAGLYNIVYYVNSDTFELLGVMDYEPVYITILEDSEIGVISVEQVGGCTVYSNFSDPIEVDAIHQSNAGLYTEIWVCSNYNGQLDLDIVLQGNPEPGGIWIGPGYNLHNGIWGPSLGAADYVYTIFHPHNSPCTPNFDSATLSLHTIDPSASLIEVSCGQNGTPNDITDDVMIVTMTIDGDGFGPDYSVSIEGGGVISPTTGLAGIPQTFTLWPGSATGSNVIINVRNLNPEHIPPSVCIWPFEVEPPGFCSDPCDYEMTSTIELVGIEEICIGNCPDEPAIATIEVEGGTIPYTMDFSIEAANFPTWSFTNIPVQAYNEIEICIDNVPAPVYNQSTNQLTLPQSLAGSYVSLTLTNVYDKYECTSLLDNDAIFLSVLALPALDTLSLVFCSEQALSADLTEYDEDINAFLDVTWYDGNPFTVGDKINFPHVANLNEVVELWAYVKDDFCENAIKVNLTVFPSPDLSPIDSVEICSGTAIALQSLQIEDIANTMATYSFHSNSPLNATTLLDPAYYLPGDSTTIFVLATAGICLDSTPVQINVQDYPDFLLQATPCNLIAETYTVIFTSSADSIYSSLGNVVNLIIGNDQVTDIPNNTNVTIELINSSGLCKDTFLITAPNCNCPFIAQPISSQPSYQICEGAAIPQMSVTVSPGTIANWYNMPIGGTLLLSNSLTYQPAIAASANYYVEAFDGTNSCSSIRTEIPFTVNPVAELQPLENQVLCETGTINLIALTPAVVNGVPGSGSWFDLNTNAPITGTLMPAQGDAWYYSYSSNPGNCKTADTMYATVHPLPSIDLFEIICDDVALTFEISFTTDATNVQVSTGNLLQVTGTDSFTLESIPFDTDIQFDLINTITGCSFSFTQSAPDCSCPALLQETEYEACSNEATIDLADFIGFGVSGTWQLVSNPPGGNPASLTGNNFNVQNADDGLYTLRFIRSVILNNCTDTALFELTVHTSPFADAGVDGMVCAPDEINLNGAVSGSNIQFSWQTNGSGSITNPNAINTSYSPTIDDISTGSVSFTLTATDQTGFCPQAQETIDITIDASAYFILSPATQTYCDTSDLVVDFDDLITFGTSTGLWFFPDTVGAPIINNSLFNPSTLSAGNYTVFYTSTNAVPPCNNETLGVNLIIENCLCPSVALTAPTTSLCSASGNQDLDDFLITGEQGAWSIVNAPAGNNPAVINGSNFVTSSSDHGSYQLRYTLNNPVAGCDDFAEINLDVIETPSIQNTTTACADDLLSWEAIINSSAESLVNSAGNIVPLGNDRYQITNIPLNTALIVTVSNGSGLCVATSTINSPDCDCTLEIANLPDDVLLCSEESILFSPSITGGKGAVTRYWIVADDTTFQNDLLASQPGIYQFVSLDELGCKEEHLVNLSLHVEMSPDISFADITCPGDQDGSIVLHGITGGNSPYLISVNDGPVQAVGSFPHLINNLSAGNYTIELIDAFNCTISTTISIQTASSENVDLGPDQTILIGDSILINPLLTFAPDSFYWMGDVDILDPVSIDNWVSPETDKSLVFISRDEKGCIYSDDINIRVLLTSSVYVPNVFSPNGDGNNDVIAPVADPSIVSIEYFEIYSRWGELVFSAYDFQPGQTNFGWNGTLRDKLMLPGVFVYRISATNKRGKVYTQYGDLTLVR